MKLTKDQKHELDWLAFDVFIDAPLWWHDAGLSETASGYGTKLTTRYKHKHNGRLYRVYATCISNVASYWILAKGKKIFIR